MTLSSPHLNDRPRKEKGADVDAAPAEKDGGNEAEDGKSEAEIRDFTPETAPSLGVLSFKTVARIQNVGNLDVTLKSHISVCFEQVLNSRTVWKAKGSNLKHFAGKVVRN